MNKKLIVALGALLTLGWGVAQADPITAFDTTMVGDTRPGIPDNLYIEIGALQLNAYSWQVTVDTSVMLADHEDLRMHEFFFNLTGAGSSYDIAVVSPTGWVLSDGTNAQASGSADFLFQYDRGNGRYAGPWIGPEEDWTALVFTVSREGMTAEDFLSAFQSYSSDDIGPGNVGAHLGSLSDSGCSGFVWGNWGETPAQVTGGEGFQATCGSTEVPEPATLALFGLGLIGFGIARRRKS